MDESVFNPQAKLKRSGLAYGPLALLLVFLLLILAMALFFRVREIEVVNASDYSDNEIIVASGIEEGVNLFFVDRFSAASRIFSKLKYMDTVSILRRMPDKIVIQAEGSAPAAWMRIDGDIWFLDRSGRMLGIVTDLDTAGYPEIRSVESVTALPGEDLLVEGTNVARMAYASELLNALIGESLSAHVSWIDLKDPANPSFYFDNRLTVYFGSMENTLYKAALLKSALTKLAADDAGTLVYSGDNNWTYSPD